MPRLHIPCRSFNRGNRSAEHLRPAFLPATCWHREILGLQVSSAEDGAGWLGFFRDLTARGLSVVELVTFDTYAGLVAAIGATLPGAAWQRRRTHWSRRETRCRFRLLLSLIRYGAFGGGARPTCGAIRGLLPHLNERQRRLMLATEARLLGHGGIRAVARAARVSETTVRRGLFELEAGELPLPEGRIRRRGGGRKRAEEVDSGVLPALMGDGRTG